MAGNPPGHGVSAHTRVTGIIGWPVGHSLSPAMHNAAFASCGLDWVYVAYPVDPDGVASAVTGLAAAGVAAIEVRADGYLLKHSDPEAIANAVRSVHAGESPLDPKAARVLLERGRGGDRGAVALSDREVEVLRLVESGLANKLIARRLGIAERTVKAHLTSVFQRIGVTDRTQAALWARDHLPPG